MAAPTHQMRPLMRAMYRGSLVALPLFVAICMPVLARTWYFATVGGMSRFTAAQQCTTDLLNALHQGGPLGTVLFLIGNIMSFGVLIVTCLIASYFWPPTRVYCILVCGLIAAIGVWISSSPYLTRWQRIVSGTTRSLDDSLTWYSEIFKYDLMALIGIVVGIIIALIFIPRTPFKLWDHYWLARGHCPHCHFDLQERADCGCSECGWNREGGIAGRERVLRDMQASIRSQTGVVVVSWTALSLAFLGLTWWNSKALIPFVTDHSPQQRLSNPESYTYTDVVLDFTVRSRTGWFGLPGEVSHMEWTAVFRERISPAPHELPRSASNAEIMAAIEGEYNTLAEITADQIGGTAVLRHGQREVQHDAALDAAQLAAWLESIFYYADPELPHEEAEAIMYVVNAWMDPIDRRGLPGLPPEHRVYSGLGSSGETDSPSRPAASGVIAVIVAFTLLWLCGCSLILRWGRKRLARLERTAIATPAENC